MALSRNFGVNRRNRLCGVHEYAFAQSIDFLELAENCTFLDRKLTGALFETADEHHIRVDRNRDPRYNYLILLIFTDKQDEIGREVD
jgi:hypothetical protein